MGTYTVSHGSAIQRGELEKIMSAVKVIRSKTGSLVGYIGNEWAGSFGESSAIDWLAEQIEVLGHSLSTKSIVTTSDIEKRRAEIESINTRCA